MFDVEIIHGLKESRVYTSVDVRPHQLDEFRDDIVGALVDRLAEDVGRERAEGGTLREYIHSESGLYVKLVLVAMLE